MLFHKNRNKSLFRLRSSTEFLYQLPVNMIPVFQFFSCKKYFYTCIPDIWSCSLRSFGPASALARVFYFEHLLELSQSLCFSITISSTKVFTNCRRNFFWQKSVPKIWLGVWHSRDGETNAKVSEMLLFTLEDRCNCSTETHIITEELLMVSVW